MQQLEKELNIRIPFELRKLLESNKKIVRNADIPVEIDRIEHIDLVHSDEINSRNLAKLYSGNPIEISVDGFLRVMERVNRDVSIDSDSLDLNFSSYNVTISYDSQNDKLIVNDFGEITYSKSNR